MSSISSITAPSSPPLLPTHYGACAIPITDEVEEHFQSTTKTSLTNCHDKLKSLLKQGIEQIKDPTNIKLTATLGLMAGVDLISSYVNSQVAGSYIFGTNPSGLTGPALLANSIEYSVLIELSNGALENVNAKQNVAVIVSKVALALISDLIVTKSLGLNSYESILSVVSLISKTLSSRLYNAKVFQIGSQYQINNEEGQVDHLKMRYLATALVVFCLDCAGATCDTLDNSSALSQTISKIISEVSGLFTIMLYNQLHKRDQHSYLVLPCRLVSIAITQIASQLIFSRDIANIFGNSLALGSSFGVILLVRIILDRLYKKKPVEELNSDQKKLEEKSLRKRLGLNWVILGVATGAFAVANRLLTASTQASIFINSAYMMSNILFTRALFDNVKSTVAKIGVIAGQLLLAYGTEQLVNYFIPNAQALSGFSYFIGNITSFAIARVASFATAMISYWTWGKYLGKTKS